MTAATIRWGSYAVAFVCLWLARSGVRSWWLASILALLFLVFMCTMRRPRPNRAPVELAPQRDAG